MRGSGRVYGGMGMVMGRRSDISPILFTGLNVTGRYVDTGVGKRIFNRGLFV